MSGPPRRDAKRQPHCVLDMRDYAQRDRKFVLGTLDLAACPRSLAEARDYVEVMLEARRSMQKDRRRRSISVESSPRPVPAPRGSTVSAT